MAISLIAFTLSWGLALVGTNRDGLYAQPDRPETITPPLPEQHH